MSDATRMLRSCAADEWRALAVAALSTLAVVVSYLARPLPLALAVDQILDHPAPFELTAADTQMLVALAGLVLAIVLLNTLGSHFADDRLENAAERIVHRLRVATYSRLQRLSLAFHERRRTGNLVSHVTGDVNAVGSLFADSLGGVASAGMVLLGMLTVSLIVDPLVAVTAFAAAPALALISYRFQPRVRALAKRRRAVSGEIASLSDESLSSIRAVKALGGEGFEEERLERKSEELQHISRESNRLEGRMSILVDSLGALALALVVVVGVLRTAAGAISIGELIILYTYARRIDRPLRGITRTVGKTSRYLARADRVAEILASDELVEDRPGAFSGARARGEIELRDVEFSYEPDRPAIAGFSLHVPAGQRLALVGRSGAGKSTLAALMARLYDPSKGQVLIDGRDARDCSVAWLREQFGLVLQETILFTGTVAENIAYGVEEASPDAVVAAAKAAGAHDFIEALPAGYDTMLGPQAVALSGGQRQRIAIARTLLRDPAVLIVDEPTMGLDAISEAAVLSGLEELMRGRTTIVITHSHRLAATAERVVEVDAGRVAEDGPPEAVLASEPRGAPARRRPGTIRTHPRPAGCRAAPDARPARSGPHGRRAGAVARGGRRATRRAGRSSALQARGQPRRALRRGHRQPPVPGHGHDRAVRPGPAGAQAGEPGARGHRRRSLPGHPAAVLRAGAWRSRPVAAARPLAAGTGGAARSASQAPADRPASRSPRPAPSHRGSPTGRAAGRSCAWTTTWSRGTRPSTASGPRRQGCGRSRRRPGWPPRRSRRRCRTCA